jgi:hypothetical protein
MLTLIEVDFDVAAGNFHTIYAYTRYAQTMSTHVATPNLTQDALREDPLYVPRN